MLKFAIKPEIGHRLILVSEGGNPFAKVWTFPKSAAWYVSIKERPPTKFIHKQKRLAFNDAMKFVEDRVEHQRKPAMTRHTKWPVDYRIGRDKK
jgi:hypothetical protein